MKTRVVNVFSVILKILFLFASTQMLADETSGTTGNRIGVHFEVEASSGQEYMYASEILGAGKSAAHNVFAAITDYPSLHPWIKDVKLVKEDSIDKKKFFVLILNSPGRWGPSGLLLKLIWHQTAQLAGIRLMVPWTGIQVRFLCMQRARLFVWNTLQ